MLRGKKHYYFTINTKYIIILNKEINNIKNSLLHSYKKIKTDKRLKTNRKTRINEGFAVGLSLEIPSRSKPCFSLPPTPSERDMTKPTEPPPTINTAKLS